MQKRVIERAPIGDRPKDLWLDLPSVAEVEITSEEPDFPVEGALVDGQGGCGWRAAAAGEQVIRLLFEKPQQLRRILHFVDAEHERTQQFTLRWSADGRTYREIVRQQWNFSPGGSTEEIEDCQVDLSAVRILEVRILPDVNGGDLHACLRRLRLA